MGRLQDAPLELLDCIMDNATVEATRNLVVALGSSHPMSESIRKSALRRCSVSRYLSKHFGSGDELLFHMALCNAYVSGSRALEFFVPGSIGPDSDWDFYVAQRGKPSRPTPCSEASAECETSRFKRYMETLGVLWEGCTNERYVDSHLHIDYGTMGTHGAAIQIVTVNSWSHEWGRWEGTYETDKFYSYFQRARPAVDAVFSFHSSCVQCVLSPGVSVHFYGKHASRGLSAEWTITTSDTEGSRQRRQKSAVEKYASRGYKYEPNICLGQRCLVAHLGSCTVVPNRVPRVPLEVQEYFRETITETKWVEQGTTAYVEPEPTMDRERKSQLVLNWVEASVGVPAHQMSRLNLGVDDGRE